MTDRSWQFLRQTCGGYVVVVATMTVTGVGGGGDGGGDGGADGGSDVEAGGRRCGDNSDRLSAIICSPCEPHVRIRRKLFADRTCNVLKMSAKTTAHDALVERQSADC